MLAQLGDSTIQVARLGNSKMATRKQIEANRRNAQRSTGPRSEQGKARVGFNALKHGLTAKHFVLPHERPEDLEAFRIGLLKDLDPIGALQQELAQNIIDCLWRLRRVPLVEAAIYRAAAEEASTDVPTAIIKTLTRYSGKFANLSRHEATLTRRLTAMLHEYQRLKENRADEPIEAPELTGVDVNVRHEEEKVAQDELLTDPAPAKLEPDPVSSEEKKAQVSFFITNSQKQALRERGYSDNDLAKMRPEEAHKVLGLV